MASHARNELDVPAAPEAVAAAVQRVVHENGHRPVGQSPDGLQLSFVTKKSALNWELDTSVLITPTPQGSHVTIDLDVQQGRPKALLDGRKNKKAAQRIADQIVAALR
ncbi:hypothetical protein RDV89_09880 [Nocardioides zeae]|uniref:DUF1499 domain-containing protein n=1 Tax=Nocardioides imazamoxiresistens TaxID=3231893 RepID=A0ABU3PWX2_9ACTN|nr:hypothetical protein [Nocardioides zeae]MDT9593376.1 hypothetical protein [Nocardioides zeae]